MRKTVDEPRRGFVDGLRAFGVPKALFNGFTGP